MTLNRFYKFKKQIVIVAAFCVVNLFSVSAANAQDIEATIKISSFSASSDDRQIHVEGKFLNPIGVQTRNYISFLRNYADVFNLESRIENLNLSAQNAAKIELKTISAGEYQAEIAFESFAYDVNVAAPENNPTAAAHVSWIKGEQGVLMLNDLLPQMRSPQPVSAKIALEIPEGWNIASSETESKKNTFFIKNAEKAIFLVGKNWREKTLQVDETELNLAIAGGEWQFSDDEAAQMASSILEEYKRIFGEIPVKKTQILILPFPQKSSRADRWRAETRGSTVTVISGIVPLKSQALQRLHEQLRHEIFHLWIPNALNLSGNYDWFYEGFAVYQALRTGVELNQIRFEDFLNTLARAYDLAQNQNVSLIEISNNRWTGSANGSVYPKGMIAAFLCDAALLRESRGKRSLTDVFREIYRKFHSTESAQDASLAILGVLKSYPELRSVVQNYIEGAAKIEWRQELGNFGIETAASGSGTELNVMIKPNGRQKDLLDKLGYNQWRKLGQKKK